MDLELISNSQDFVGEVRRLLNKMATNSRIFEAYCMAFFGVTPAQGSTILSIPLDKNLKMNALSSIMGVDNSTMTRTIDQLVDKGIVCRHSDEKDRRLVNIGLTASGQQLRKEIAKEFDYFNTETLDQIPGEERAVIIQSLEKLNDAIERRLKICCRKLKNRSNN